MLKVKQQKTVYKGIESYCVLRNEKAANELFIYMVWTCWKSKSAG